MSKFNSTLKSKPDAHNFEGALAYTKSAKLQIASILLTSFCMNSYYEQESDTLDRLADQYVQLKPEDKEFLAKAAIFARREFGMRSITHVASGIILNDLKENKYSWAKGFFKNIVSRPDDMAEIISYYWKDGKKPLPNSLKKGFALAFNRFDDYQIAKYKMENKAVSLIDIVNLVHPKPTSKNEKSLKELVAGTLKQEGTWSAELSEAGKSAKTVEEKEKNKAEVWERFVSKGEKVEIFALLRNLKNIMEQASSSTLKTALQLLTTDSIIRNSKILPFRFLTAFEQFNKLYDPRATKVQSAIATAMDKAICNVPSLEGRTLVALDHSGSMFFGSEAENQRFTPASIYAAAIFKGAQDDFENTVDICMFNNYTKIVNPLPQDSLMTIAGYLRNQAEGGGTNSSSVFELMNTYKRKYDRIILITDEQDCYSYSKRALANYKKNLDINPKLYYIDVAGYATQPFHEENCYCLSGLSEKLFDIMSKMEQDPKALVHTIEQVKL